MIFYHILPYYDSIYVYKISVNYCKNKATKAVKNMKKNRLKTITAICILTIGTGAVIYGSLTGGFKDVWQKAVIICNECIGLG